MPSTYLTKDGLTRLQAEHKLLLKQKLELTEEVSAAAAMGDLRENAEYHAARERLQHVTKRLMELDNSLSHVTLIDDLKLAADEARLGACVKLEDEQTHERFTYQLVGPEEADPGKGTLSIASPIGRSLLGKKSGDRVTVQLPKAAIRYRILSVTRPGCP